MDVEGIAKHDLAGMGALYACVLLGAFTGANDQVTGIRNVARATGERQLEIGFLCVLRFFCLVRDQVNRQTEFRSAGERCRLSSGLVVELEAKPHAVFLLRTSRRAGAIWLVRKCVATLVNAPRAAVFTHEPLN